MAGQLIKRAEKSYVLRVYLGRDPLTGKRLYQNRTFHGLKKDAETALADMVKEREMGPALITSRGLTVGTLLDGVLADYRINALRSLDRAEGATKVHLKPFCGDVPASKFTTDMAKSYIEQRRREGASNGTLNRELSLLRRAFTIAAKESTPPKVSRVPVIPTLKENNTRQGFLEDSQYRALLVELPDYLRPLVSFAYYTGCRRGEILSLRWEQVDLVRGVIRLEAGTTKNKQARVIPLVSELVEALRVQRIRRDTLFPSVEHVFFGVLGEPVRDFNKAWIGACKRAGLWDGDEETGKPRFIFHDLRRTGVRNLVRAGVPESVAMRISGHQTRMIFERYNITSEADQIEAAAKLERHMGQVRSAHTQATTETERHTIGTQTRAN